MVKKINSKNAGKAVRVEPKRCCQCLKQTKALTPGYVVCVYHHVLAWSNSLACEDFDDVEVY